MIHTRAKRGVRRDPVHVSADTLGGVYYPLISTVLAYKDGTLEYNDGKLSITFDITSALPYLKDNRSWVIHLHESKVAQIRELIPEADLFKEEHAVRCTYCGERL